MADPKDKYADVRTFGMGDVMFGGAPSRTEQKRKIDQSLLTQTKKPRKKKGLDEVGTQIGSKAAAGKSMKTAISPVQKVTPQQSSGRFSDINYGDAYRQHGVLGLVGESMDATGQLIRQGVEKVAPYLVGERGADALNADLDRLSDVLTSDRGQAGAEARTVDGVSTLTPEERTLMQLSPAGSTKLRTAEGTVGGTTRTPTENGGQLYRTPHGTMESDYTPRRMGQGGFSVDSTSDLIGRSTEGMSRAEKSQARVDYYNKTADSMKASRQAQNALRGNQRLTPQSGGISSFDRNMILKQYKRELRGVYDDMSRGNITAPSSRNKLNSINEFFKTKLGLSPQAEEGGKDARAQLAADTALSQTGMREKGALTRSMLDKNDSAAPEISFDSALKESFYIDPASGRKTYPDNPQLNQDLTTFYQALKANPDNKEQLIEQFKERHNGQAPSAYENF